MDNQRLVSCMLDMGEIMVMSGGEASRIEDTLIRIGKSYGYKRVDVFTITTSILLTVDTGTEIITQTRRITKYAIDMQKVERVNCLSRTICTTQPSLEYIKEKLENIQKCSTYPEPVMLLTYGVVAGAFAIFFGGTVEDGVASFIAALFLRVVLLAGNRLKMNPVLLIAFSSAVVGMVVMLLYKAGLGNDIDKIVIGNVMLLIPGLALTSSLRDMISGDIMTGLLGITESLLKALAIALGFSVLLLQIGGL